MIHSFIRLFVLTLIILGIDPGLARTGWGVIEKQGQDVKLVDYGCIETDPHKTNSERLVDIHQGILNVLKHFSPQAAAVETLIFNTNVKTAMMVGQARGVVLLALAQNGVKTREFTPLQIKQAVAGYGRASKSQIQKMVKTLLHLNKVPRPDDAADALAVAISLSAVSGV